MDFLTLLQVLDTTVRLATPLLFACLAGLFSERAGIFDIGLEGKMLIAAFFSGALAATSGSVWIGLLAGVGASLALSMVHGLASITFRGNQLISGVAINFLAAGLSVLIAQSWFQQGGRTPSLTGDARFNEIRAQFEEFLPRLDEGDLRLGRHEGVRDEPDLPVHANGRPGVGAQDQVRALGLDKYFDILVSKNDVKQGKPHPETFLMCAEAMNISPEFCQVFEDGDPGLQAARTAGMIATDIRAYV